jgi:thiosulfate reductase cytochrome b subunit
MKIILLFIGSLLFIISFAAHIYIKLKLRPKQDSDFDDIYWEFEETHPGFARYNRLSQMAFTGMIFGAILLFLAVIF